MVRLRQGLAGCVCGLGFALSGPLQAQSAYVGVGAAGLSVGVAWASDPEWGARAEWGGLPVYERTFAKDGIDYTGKVRGQRAALLLDWHVWQGGFRLTTGLSGQHYTGEFTGVPALGNTLALGNAQVQLGPQDQYTVRIKLPAVMPYIGLGWGHAPQRGWGVHADLGVLVGTPRVSGALSPSLTQQINSLGLNPQAELDRELQTVRAEADKVPVFPVLAVGVSYRW